MDNKTTLKALTLGAIGVVYGDIGTSPLYTIHEIFAGSHPMEISSENVRAILSLLFWSLIFVVTLKYVIIMLRADNNGEGGIIALMELALRTAKNSPYKTKAMVTLGMCGASLFFADGVITPAISVLGAVEGIEVLAPSFKEHIIPIALGILFVLFWAQKKGTGSIGALFGPVMCVWFLVIGGLGIYHIAKEPSVLLALNPAYAISFIVKHNVAAFYSLGGVVLALTGAEALYADMGHFGKKPIRLAWVGIVLPSLVLNYFGQCALLLHTPKAIDNPFFFLVPSWGLIPLILLSTAAAIIASQAVIAGAFSVAKQAMLLGFAPRLDITYTSDKIGQIYVPFINWLLFTIIAILVINFKSSTNLGAAYGVAVTGTMVTTTFLSYAVIRHVWKWHRLAAIGLVGIFITFDAAYFSANVIKIKEGGWIPLLIGSFIYILMTTWKKERSLHLRRSADDEMSLEQFIGNIKKSDPYRPDGTAIYLTASPGNVPHSLLHNLYHNRALHETVLIITVKTLDIPHVPESDRVQVEHLEYGFHRITVGYGFKDDPDLPRALELSREKGIAYEPMRSSYFLGRDSLVSREGMGLCHWREILYVWMFRNSSGAPEYFRIPPNRVIELGTQRAI